MSRVLAVAIVDRNGLQHPGEFVVTTGELDTPQWLGVVNPLPEATLLGVAAKCLMVPPTRHPVHIPHPARKPVNDQLARNPSSHPYRFVGFA